MPGKPDEGIWVIEVSSFDATPGEFPRPGVMRTIAATSTVEVDPGELNVGAQVDVTFRLDNHG